MMISVVIPTCHRNDMLAKCLKKLSPGQQELLSDVYEVIVTDDGSLETAESMIKKEFPWVRWVKGQRRGPAANRNNGVKYANGEWIVFTDDDCLPDSNWLQAYANAIEMNPNMKVFEGRTYADRPRKSFAEVAPINELGGVLPSCNFCIEKETFLKLNGFDEEYSFSFEDMDLHYRLKMRNYKVHFIWLASVCHPWRTIDKKKIRKDYTNQKIGIECFIRKHPEAIKTFNSIHFIREAIRNLFFNMIPKIIIFRGAGFTYGLWWRYLEVSMGISLMPDTIKYFLERSIENR